jgi:hypothetical protein
VAVRAQFENTDRCDCIAPFGSPVVPDVYATVQRLPAGGGLVSDPEFPTDIRSRSEWSHSCRGVKETMALTRSNWSRTSSSLSSRPSEPTSNDAPQSFAA